jgi:hypothetical protein
MSYKQLLLKHTDYHQYIFSFNHNGLCFGFEENFDES